MQYIGVDYGSKRIGIAVSDEDGNMAFPHSVIQNNKNSINVLVDFVAKRKAGCIVVGESKDFSGKDNSVMVEARAFASELKNKTGVSVVFEPEFMTSAEAERLQGVNKELDASAAALILKSYIDKQKNDNN